MRRSGCDAEGWTLFWSDGVAKDWTERYSDLSIALARLATLQHCGESDWELGFTHTADEFAQQAAEFFAATTR